MIRKLFRLKILLVLIIIAAIWYGFHWLREGVNMPGKSYNDYLDQLDPYQLRIRDNLKMHVDMLADQIGERNLTNGGLYRAADYIRQSRLPQPLLNSYPWGGFLTWYLPDYPVAIDGRSDLYGADINTAYFRLIQAEVPLDSHPAFAQARTILLEANSPMAAALSSLPGYRVVYRDDQAIVLVPQQ